ncbi:S1C family serine protease [Planctomyces sp. SH-PL14]|jgi:S1-C subfamily serine protease|uniref:S1C family serine protease n=1 Tax=Planctomyces sp. SH-PL14 TaxID=1632864 RepID=UPI00078CEF71|nr:trypsin-like peptidase domain-containing protein [Planctomyces sp. SH-PL14]AMV18615.1 Periplasmic serine endoprotease DegP precursor [Planctomyces sp. SH-PL14]
MRTLAVCIFAGIVSSLVTLWMLNGAPMGQSDAQVPPFSSRAKGNEEKPFQAARANAFNAEGLTPDELINVTVYEQCNKSVVNISTTARSGRLFSVTEQGNGSGAVISRDGHILTNFHVISGASQITVNLQSGESYGAKVIGKDPLNDIAVIQIDAPEEELFPVELGDSETLKVGMRVFALGNPFGLDRTMSCGVISSLNRTLEIHENWVIKSIIQIDAAINPGNSGGPLLDSHGRLIGINTAIASRVGESAGIGFAIPVNLIRRVVPELLKYGRVVRGEIGITHVSQIEQGLRIRRLSPKGPGERAGLRGPKLVRRGPFMLEDIGAADVIIKVDGEKIETPADFLGRIESKKPGQKVVVTVLREEQEVDVTVLLGGEEMPASAEVDL